MSTLKDLWGRIPQSWKDRAVGAAVSYVATMYGPAAGELAGNLLRCAMGGH